MHYITYFLRNCLPFVVIIDDVSYSAEIHFSEYCM